jgi:hypothetical protein
MYRRDEVTAGEIRFHSIRLFVKHEGKWRMLLLQLPEEAL